MLEFALVIVFVFATSALLGHIAHVRASPEKLSWYMQVKEWKAREYSMALFIGLIALLFILTGISKATGWKVPAPHAVGVLTATCLSALLYLGLLGEKYLVKIANHKGLLKVAGGALGVCFVTASKIVSDMAIAELTNLPPQELPGAQMLLTLIMQPVLALVIISLLLGYISIPITFGTLAWWIYQEIKTNRGTQPTYLTASYICAFIAITVSTITLLTMTSSMLKQSFYEKRLRIAIAHSAFHLPPSYCGLPDTEGAAIASLKYRRAALAVPDTDKGYTFSSLSCDPKLDSQQKLAALLAERKTDTNTTE